MYSNLAFNFSLEVCVSKNVLKQCHGRKKLNIMPIIVTFQRENLEDIQVTTKITSLKNLYVLKPWITVKILPQE